MKKLLSVLLLFAILISVPSFAPAAEASSTTYYTTSTGITFSLDEVIIYWDDLENLDFDTSQEMIDFIYRIGKNRPSIASEHIDLFGTLLTEAEIELIIIYPLFAPILYLNNKMAVAKTEELYNSEERKDGKIGNAFQHAYWVILMNYWCTPYIAISFAVAHEEYDGNPTIHKTMDLYNDYAAYDYCQTLGTYVDMLTLDEYAQYLVTSGQLEYIIENYRYVYKITTYLDTGRTLIQYRNRDFYAKTNSIEPYGVPEPIIEEIPEDPMVQINGVEDGNSMN